MRYKILSYLLPGLLTFQVAVYGQGNRQKEPSSEAKMNVFVSDLMKKMTLDEKIGQLNVLSVGFSVTGPVLSQKVDEKIKSGMVGAVFNTFTPTAVRKLQETAVNQTRLKIPLLLGFDVIHGHRTIFPMPIGLSCTWDLNAIEKSAAIAAEEASADGVNWTFSPMVDITRDPRWGRVVEGGGEDTWLGSKIAEAMVKGYQGNDLTDYKHVMACVKHFALYGAAESGRDYNTVDMSERRMFQDYLPPYKAAIDAGAGSVMTSFNDINDVPATANKWLLTDLLRKQWGFKGFVVTDYTAIPELIAHGVAKNGSEAANLAINAGVDGDMVGENYTSSLKQLLQDGKLKLSTIDAACKRILEAKYKLGLFTDPYRGLSEENAKATLMNPEFIKATRDLARKSFVLLKNQNQVLPLKTNGSIALIGPLANSQRDMIGNWSAAGNWKQAVSIEQGIKNVAGNSLKINYAKGVEITDDSLLLRRLNGHGGNLNLSNRPSDELIAEAVEVAKKSDLIVAVVGESQGMSGEAASRSDIGLPGLQLDLLKALKKTGKPLVIVLMNGRPLQLNWADSNADAILETWFAGTEGGNAIADVLFGLYNPSGKLTMTFPKATGQIPIYYNHKSTGRPYTGKLLDKYKSRYLDVDNEPLYPFGFGLSYSSFAFSPVTLSNSVLRPDGSLTVNVQITNTGKYDGEEVVQLYVQDVVASITRPVKELKNFKKIFLKAGESKQVSFIITEKDLRFYDLNMHYISEPGDFKIFVGPNSRDVQEAGFILKNN